eukprot:12259266-Prorocentrum_lima.AAC.1
MLEGFLSRLLDPEVQPCLADAVQHSLGQCDQGTGCAEPCWHVNQVLHKELKHESPQLEVAQFLRKCFAWIWVCKSCNAMAKELIKVLDVSIQKRLPDLGLRS